MRLQVVTPLMLAAWACGGDAVPESSPPATPDAAVIEADTATVAVPVTLPGQLYVEHDAVLYARATGIVESVYVDLGAVVARGDTLARLESADQEIALEEARARLANAERAVRRARSLAGTGVVTAADSEQAELTMRESALAARRAEREYQFTRVIAPFAGLVTQRQTRPGRMVEVGNPLFRVSAQSPLLVSVHVPESAAAQVGVGIGAEVVGLDGTRGDAQVIRASPMLDGASGTREVVLRVPSGPGFAPGASVQVRLPGDRGPAVVIPADLVTADGHVLVQAGDRTVLRAVRLGEALPDGRVVITQGLAAGERVVRR